VGCLLPLVRVLQLLRDSPDLAGYSSDGSGYHGSRLGPGGIASVDRSRGVALG
jgi:hypothetical protein